MPWNNDPIILYHGTDDISAVAVAVTSPLSNHSINLGLCKALSDFGRGFYTTTNLNQAQNWANTRFRRASRSANPAKNATVLQFEVDRNQLAALQSLTFVTEDTGGDYWELITHCRTGAGNHKLWGYANYDVVFGPVSLWPQTLVIKDCDQVSFHTNKSLRTAQLITVVFVGQTFLSACDIGRQECLPHN